MITNVSFGSMFNPDKNLRRHVEGNLINPENNIERLNAHQASPVLGKIGREPKEEMDFGKIGKAEPLFLSSDEILGRNQILMQNHDLD